MTSLGELLSGLSPETDELFQPFNGKRLLTFSIEEKDGYSTSYFKFEGADGQQEEFLQTFIVAGEVRTYRDTKWRTLSESAYCPLPEGQSSFAITQLIRIGERISELTAPKPAADTVINNSDTAVSTQISSPEDRWLALVRYDDAVSEAAQLLRPYVEEWISKLGKDYFALGEDRRYLKKIASTLAQEAEAVLALLRIREAERRTERERQLEALIPIAKRFSQTLFVADAMTLLKGYGAQVSDVNTLLSSYIRVVLDDEVYKFKTEYELAQWTFRTIVPSLLSTARPDEQDFVFTAAGEITTEESLLILREARAKGYVITVDGGRFAITHSTRGGTSFLQSNAEIARFGKFVK